MYYDYPVQVNHCISATLLAVNYKNYRQIFAKYLLTILINLLCCNYMEVIFMKGIKVPVEVYSRVVGYFRPVSQWNNGKRAEFRERTDLMFDSALSENEASSCLQQQCQLFD